MFGTALATRARRKFTDCAFPLALVSAGENEFPSGLPSLLWSQLPLGLQSKTFEPPCPLRGPCWGIAAQSMPQLGELNMHPFRVPFFPSRPLLKQGIAPVRRRIRVDSRPSRLLLKQEIAPSVATQAPRVSEPAVTTLAKARDRASRLRRKFSRKVPSLDPPSHLMHPLELPHRVFKCRSCIITI